ncbi:MAG: helix-turn-helix domain-containing protein [Mucilaginibacter sp.]|uniref:AraC family transcriptional regulator n=1 Tax=Mucilaginibacter sp. TaxID=1882438 RepID=UPI003263029A
MLIWVTEGYGQHEIDAVLYEMVPGRLFLIQYGQVHRMIKYGSAGWLLLFEEALISGFLLSNWQQQVGGIMEDFSAVPFVTLQKPIQDVMNELFRHLNLTMKDGVPDLKLSRHYICLILLYAGQGFSGDKRAAPISPQLEMIRKLKTLIEAHFISERRANFYSSALHLTEQKLNLLVRNILGKTVHQLITERLLLECKVLLIYTNTGLKEIAYGLGFADMSQFRKFLDKHTGYPPSLYRTRNQFF